MDDPRLPRGIHSETDRSDSVIRTSYSLIQKCCLGAGLAASEADDIAQDIWLWLVREGRLTTEISMPWLVVVARNFILRHRRRQCRRRTLEGSLESCPEPCALEALPNLEAGDLLDRVAAVVAGPERKMLALIRSGYSIAESARLLSIPRGSRAYYPDRLVACGRREISSKRGFEPAFQESLNRNRELRPTASRPGRGG